MPGKHKSRSKSAKKATKSKRSTKGASAKKKKSATKSGRGRNIEKMKAVLLERRGNLLQGVEHNLSYQSSPGSTKGDSSDLAANALDSDTAMQLAESGSSELAQIDGTYDVEGSGGHVCQNFRFRTNFGAWRKREVPRRRCRMCTAPPKCAKASQCRIAKPLAVTGMGC